MSKILKDPKTFSEQITILKSRKLIIGDLSEAENFLSHNNYYRVSAYFRPYYKVDSGKVQDEFKESVTFNHVKELYLFDSELRRLLVPILEKIEVSFRTRLAYYFAHEKGPLSHMSSSHFKDSVEHNKLLLQIAEATKDPKDEFLKHYKLNYGGQYPIWVIIEALSFGNLSKFYSNMINADKTKFCKLYYSGMHHEQLKNWMMCLVILRNICAHHGRVFNRNINTPNFRNRTFILLNGYEDRVFSMILIMKTLLDDYKTWNHFVYELKYIIDKYSFSHLIAMGFDDGWEKNLVSNEKAFKMINRKLSIKKAYDKFMNKFSH